MNEERRAIPYRDTIRRITSTRVAERSGNVETAEQQQQGDRLCKR